MNSQLIKREFYDGDQMRLDENAPGGSPQMETQVNIVLRVMQFIYFKKYQITPQTPFSVFPCLNFRRKLLFEILWSLKLYGSPFNFLTLPVIKKKILFPRTIDDSN